MSIFTKTPDTTFDPSTAATENIAGDYTIDASHSRLGFSARHAMVTTVRGHFDSWSGTAHIDTENPQNSWVNLSIDAASIKTGNADRDGHLISADFFDTQTYPEIQFKSTSVSNEGETWTIEGDLTIKGTAKPVTLEFEYIGSSKDPFGNLRVGFEGSSILNRKDWGLTWNAALETGGVLVSEKIKLDFDISAIQQS